MGIRIQGNHIQNVYNWKLKKYIIYDDDLSMFLQNFKVAI